MQLTFVSAYRALRGGKSSISLRPWLYTIARNRCVSELRARRDWVDVDGVAVDRPFVEGLADQVQRREELREMLQDMQRLPADQRAALVLFELGDHSHKEIAAVLGVRGEKVKALIFQAREALVRGRQARNNSVRRDPRACSNVARQGPAPQHDPCPHRSLPGCASFEDEVRRQRSALALILPVALTGGSRLLLLGSALAVAARPRSARVRAAALRSAVRAGAVRSSLVVRPPPAAAAALAQSPRGPVARAASSALALVRPAVLWSLLLRLRWPPPGSRPSVNMLAPSGSVGWVQRGSSRRSSPQPRSRPGPRAQVMSASRHSTLFLGRRLP